MVVSESEVPPVHDGGLLIRPDLFAPIDFRLFVSVGTLPVALTHLICSLLFSKCSARSRLSLPESLRKGRPLFHRAAAAALPPNNSRRLRTTVFTSLTTSGNSLYGATASEFLSRASASPVRHATRSSVLI